MFDYTTNKLVCSAYLKQIQNCFAFLPDPADSKKRESKSMLKQSWKTAKKMSRLRSAALC